MVARLRVILRRTGRGVEEPRNARLTFADIELDEDTHEVWKAGEPVSLSPTEFTLLRYFIINAGTVLSKPKILDHVWRYDFGGDVNVVESYVSYLRRKIDTGEKRLLHTLRGRRLRPARAAMSACAGSCARDNRGHGEHCADEASRCGSGWWPPPWCWWPAACSPRASPSPRSCGTA